MNNLKSEIISNENIDIEKIKKASEILLKLQAELSDLVQTGSGPFLAAIYDQDYNLIAKASNSVVKDNCSSSHAEMNVIKLAQSNLKTYDLAPYNLSLYVTSEPCIMCIGGIMWSGIKNVFYGVPSKTVEAITGFDEGFKPNWLDEFKSRGITVYGNIEPESGEKTLLDYVNSGKTIYKPTR